MLHNDEAERALLGCLLNGTPAVDDVADMLQGRDFYQPRNEAVWDACMTVHRRGDRIDPLTLPVPANGRQYLIDLVATGHGVHAMQYAQEVLDLAVRRRVAEAGRNAVTLAENTDLDPTEAAAQAERAMSEAVEQAAHTESGRAVGDAMDDVVDWLENPPVGAETPWQDVNDRTNGILAGQLITVAGRPGHGKSLIAKDVAVFTAKQGRPVHVATLEMTRNEYMARILAAEARVPLANMLKRQMTSTEWGKVTEAGVRLSKLPLYLDDREGQTMAQIRAAARRTQRRYGQPLGLIAIDYAGLVRVPGVPLSDRRIAMGVVSGTAKSMAKEFGCPVMLLAQLNRGNAQRQDHTPVVTDLKESGDLEQDSDQVWLLHRPDQYGQDRLGELDLIVGKNRNAQAPITIPLAFLGHYAQVASLA